MGAHYSYFNSLFAELVGSPASSEIVRNSEKLAMALALGAGLVLGGRALTARLASSAGQQTAIVPSERITGFGIADYFVETFVKFHDSILGREGRRHVPFNAAIFFFVLFANLLGLVPGMVALTTTVWVNVGLGLVVFCYFNWQGIKAQGFLHYLKHFGGPVWWLFPFMFVLEIFSTCLRVFTLNLRLYWNITADHIVLGIFTDLTSIIVPIIFYAIGTFVCFMQAFVFTTLTMIYIHLASAHEGGHKEEHAH